MQNAERRIALPDQRWARLILLHRPENGAMPFQVIEMAWQQPLDLRSWINTDLTSGFRSEGVSQQYATIVLKRNKMRIKRRVVSRAQTEAVVPVKPTPLVLAPRNNVGCVRSSGLAHFAHLIWPTLYQ